MQEFHYGNEDVSGNPGKNNGLTESWLDSSLAISPEEQITFITKLLQNKLPVSAKAQALTREILPTETLSNGWKIYGKTGSGGNQLGWFVGWVIKDKTTLVFAYLIQGNSKKGTYAGPQAREQFKTQFIKFIEKEPKL